LRSFKLRLVRQWFSSVDSHHNTSFHFDFPARNIPLITGACNVPLRFLVRGVSSGRRRIPKPRMCCKIFGRSNRSTVACGSRALQPLSKAGIQAEFLNLQHNRSLQPLKKTPDGSVCRHATGCFAASRAHSHWSGERSMYTCALLSTVSPAFHPLLVGTCRPLRPPSWRDWARRRESFVGRGLPVPSPTFRGGDCG